ELLGKIARGRQPLSSAEGTGQDRPAEAAVDLPEQRLVLRKRYDQLHARRRPQDTAVLVMLPQLRPLLKPWSTADARVRGDPVHFPALAAVVRKGLLEAPGVGAERGDDEPHEDSAAVEGLLVVELAAAVLELADGRLAQRPAARIGEVEARLAGGRVVEPEAHALEVAGRAVGHQLHEVGLAVQDAPYERGALVFEPGLRAGERMIQAFELRFPGADLEIEVVLSVP